MAFENELKVAQEAAQLARSVLLKYFGNLKNIEFKEQAGLVSEADRAAEKVIKNHLLASFADYGFLGEEEAFENSGNIDSHRCESVWVVDPLDGTTNYIHRFPIFCISISLVINQKPVLGVIDVPRLNDTYWATLGAGSYHNGKRIYTSSSNKLINCLAGTGFNSERKDILEEQLKKFDKIVGNVRGIRRSGSAAYDLCMVASGVFDFFWEQNLSPWDVAGGQIIVDEAGGKNSCFDGSEFNPWKNSLLSSNGKVHQSIVKIISQ